MKTIDTNYSELYKKYSELEALAEDFVSKLHNAEILSTLFCYDKIDIGKNGIEIRVVDDWRGGKEWEYVSLPSNKMEDIDGYVAELVEDKRLKKEEDERKKREEEIKKQNERVILERQEYERLKAKFGK